MDSLLKFIEVIGGVIFTSYIFGPEWGATFMMGATIWWIVGKVIQAYK